MHREATTPHSNVETLRCPECDCAVGGLVADDYGNVTATCPQCKALFDFEDLQCSVSAPVAATA